jgi:thiol:disulfide interchange protein DsbC
VSFRGTLTPRRLLLLLLFVLVIQPVMAESKQPGADRVLKRMLALAPEIVVDEIVPTQIPGLYELRIGPRIVYVTSNGRYLIQGSIVDMQTRKNLTEPSLQSATVKALETLGEDNMLVSGPPEVKHTVTVFTDIDSGSCRQLHRQLDEYHAKGIRIRYLFFPRAGLLSPSYKKAVSIWCSKDAMGAMDSAARGEELTKQNCPNPIAGHMLLGEQLGVTSTPTLVLPNGRVLPGYVAPDPLSGYLQNVRPAGR